MHLGQAVGVVRRAQLTAWALLPGDDGVTPLEAVGALLGLGYRRTALLADQLRAEAELSTEAVFGPLAEAERRERELLLRTALAAQQMGFEEHRHTVQMELGGQLVRLVRGLVRDLGHDDQAPEVAAVIRRHLLALEAG
jgi:hypothetical protein